jgi:perosamine synthetase
VEKKWAEHVYWMYNIVLNDRVLRDRDGIINSLKERGIETRPTFYPNHKLPPYLSANKKLSLPVAERIAARGITLPTWDGLTKNDVKFISETLLKCLN